jgi:predicted lipoprotein
MRFILFAAALFVAGASHAKEPDIQTIVATHVIPGYQTLANQSADLVAMAEKNCSPKNPALLTAYHRAFDAWIGVSHLRFGPSEQEDRAFALAFWPDPRGSTPKTLATLIRDQDTVVASTEAFATVSVAARGFYALEFLLFDPQFASGDKYMCDLLQAVAADIETNANAILKEWQSGYGDLISMPGNDIYRSSAEAAQQFFTALSTGLEFTAEARLGRPLGTFERPRPNRSEARRSERSLRNVILSLTATKELGMLIAADDAELERMFDAALQRAETLNDPVFAGVARPQDRFKVETLKQNIDTIRRYLAEQVGPDLGIASGFNSLDGD